MERRQFLTSSLAASALALAEQAAGAQTAMPSGKAREYYEIRKYLMQSGPQTKITSDYVSQALIPALNRLGITPVGAFDLFLGPATPTLYLLLPSKNLDTLINARLHLEHDDAFVAAAAPFWNAPATDPPFIRVESSLLIAFEGWPQVVVPPATAQHGQRIFQLRIYESPTQRDHLRKIEMMHSGEFDFFRKAGFDQVFYGDTLIGPRMPNLTYMVSYPELADLDPKWAAFSADPDWKKLTANPKFSFEHIVGDITSLILKPTTFSQI